jgi:LCP family protein required for cell wall assembly
VVAVAGALGVVVATGLATSGLREVAAVGPVLDRGAGPVVNYLLVGSDSREGADPDAPDAGAIGGVGDAAGQRSDTIMVLRYDTASGAVSLLSLPRDLWVEIPGYRHERINSAFARGPEVLVRTVQTALGLPVHHYLEVDFFGFKDLVDAVGGVEVCVDTPVRDTNSGLNLPEAGCHVLDGVQALAYTRSRYYQRLVDGQWVTDPTSDLGRTERQRAFVQATARTAFDHVAANPFRAGAVMTAVTGALAGEPGFDLVEFAARLRPVARGGITSYALPVRGETIDGKAVLRLASGSDAVLAYFRGAGPPPAP